MPQIPQSTKTTLWIWPSGLFPRRLMYYFRAKHITLSTLHTHDIHLVPIQLTTSPPSLQSMPGHEKRPENASLPILRIEHDNGRVTWIRESLSILEYFEEIFSQNEEEGWKDLRGETAEQRACTCDVLGLLDDAVHWNLVHLIHSDPKTTVFSGLTEEDMSPSAARHAGKKVDFYLERLETWIEGSGNVGKATTLAGMVLLAQVEYHGMMFGADWIEGYTVLREWVELIKKEEWYVENAVLKSVEEDGDWKKVLQT